jgi:hypothetical protein
MVFGRMVFGEVVFGDLRGGSPVVVVLMIRVCRRGVTAMM